MKKIFSLLSLVMLMFAVSANAQSRKTWDFSKGVSDESRAALDADASWTKTVADGVTTAWASASNINGEAMANGNVVKELSGLYFSDFAAVNALLYRITNIRLQKNCAITIKGVTAGEKVVIKAQSANTTATDRGFALDNAQDANGNSSFICLGRDAAGAPEGGVTTVEATVIADGDLKISIGVNGAPKSGIEILSIVLGDGDKNIKKWDFSAFSEATVNQVCAAEDWTVSESASKNYITGNEIRWINTPTLDANDDLTAGGEAIKELKGLRHDGLAQYSLGLAFNYGQTLDDNHWGPYKGGSYIWVMGNATKIIVPNVKSGSTFKLGVESHNPSDARGFKVLAGGVEVDTKTTIDYQEFSYAIPASADEYVDVEIVATKGCHLYFIEAEVKDETVVDKNPKLGVPEFSIKNGTKVSPLTTELTIAFKKTANIPAVTPIIISGWFGVPGETSFEDGEVYIEDEISNVMSLAIADYAGGELQKSTKYQFYINKIEVEGFPTVSVEAKEGENLFELNFETSGPGIKEPRAWEFKTTVEDAEAIVASIKAGEGIWTTSSKGRYGTAGAMSNAELMLNKETKFAYTEGLYFSTTTAGDVIFGTEAHTTVDGTSYSGNNGRMQFSGNAPLLTIPSCNKGDVITITGMSASKSAVTVELTNASNKETGEASFTCPGSSSAQYQIVVNEDNDVVLKCKGVVFTKIEIAPFNPDAKEVNYSIEAQTPDGNALKTLAEGKTMQGDIVKGNYPYWLSDSEGTLYTYGTKGTPFEYSVAVKEEGVQPITYKASEIADVVYVSEAEDINPDMVLCTHQNAAIRSSNGKAAYNEFDVKLVTLEPGTYKILVVIFDPTGQKNHLVSFKIGNSAETVDLVADSDNFTETESDLITVEETSDVVLLPQGNSNKGLDIVCIYASDEMPDDPDNVVVAKADNSNVVPVKVVEDNKILIKTAKGTFNAAGMQVK